MMINSIILSKDRASQLRLLLESIAKNAVGIFNITVIYTTSNTEFEKGYEKLKLESVSSGVKWIQQTDFKNNILQALHTNADFSCFFIDDDIIYRKFDNDKITNAIKGDQDVFCFSLRLGLNTNFCYNLNTPNNLHNEEKSDGVIKFDWSKNFLDFGYPLSLHGNIFRTRDIVKLTKQVGFKNPNQFEEALQIFETYPKFKMASFENSVLINSPFKVGTNEQKNVIELNIKYLNGEIIELDALSFENINACFKELEYKFKTFQDA